MKIQLTKPQLANLPLCYKNASFEFANGPANLYKESFSKFSWDELKLYTAQDGLLYLFSDGKHWQVKNPEFFYAANVRHLKAAMGFMVGIKFRVYRGMDGKGDNCRLECAAKLWFTEQSRIYFSTQQKVA